MKTQLPQSITSVGDTMEFIDALHENNEIFSFNEDAKEVVNGLTNEPMFTPGEADKLNELVYQISELELVKKGTFSPMGYMSLKVQGIL